MNPQLQAIVDFLNKPATGSILRIINIIVVLILFFVGANLKEKYDQIDNSIKEISVIKAQTTKLTSQLEPDLNGGQRITVGANPKEIKENIAFVFEDNRYRLKLGDVIFLKNYADNTFQPTLRFVIQKEIPRNGDKSKAELFISQDAVKRFGISLSQGVFEAKLLRQAAETKSQ